MSAAYKHSSIATFSKHSAAVANVAEHTSEMARFTTQKQASGSGSRTPE